MSSSNTSRHKKTESKESTENRGIKDIEDVIIDNPLTVKKLYPSLSIDGKFAKNLLLSNEKEESTFQKKKPTFLMDAKENPNELSESFLKELIKKPCTLDKDKIIDVMTEFIQNSPLLQKFQKDIENDKNFENNELSRMGAKHLNYIECKKGQILFRIGDNGDRFYFILSGRVSILKLREINNVQMTYFEYIDYCMYLITQKEFYIFNKVKNRNMKLLSLNSESDVISIFKIFFIKKLKDAILQDLLPDTKSLIKYLKKYGFKLQDFNLKIAKLYEMESNEDLEPEYKREEWNKYLIEKCTPSYSDLMVYEIYKKLFQKDLNQKKTYTCYIYKPFLFLGKGLFFGDFALDSDMNKRNATIRAEENTILAFMKSADYINIFAPRRKMEKMREINFLYNNYFFRKINQRSFEKNYFHLFSPHEYDRSHELFDFGSSLNSLILLKEGKINLEIKASVADLYDLIEYLWENISKNKNFQNLNNIQKRNIISISTENRIKQYIQEKPFRDLKSHGEKFFKEMNKIKIFQIYIYTNKEIIGLEEYYLGIPYIMRGTVLGDKINCYQIDIENFENVLYQERQIMFNYIKSSVDKIISLIDRLQNIKINQIKMYKTKFENEINDFIEVSKMNKEKSTKKVEIINKNASDGKVLYKRYINNKIDNKIYKSPVKAFATNLNPLARLMRLKKNKINKKLNNSNSCISFDKISNFSSVQTNKNDCLINKYNSFVIKKVNDSKVNNLSSNEEVHSTFENNETKSKYDNKNILSTISSNKMTTNQIKINFNSQRNLLTNNLKINFNSDQKAFRSIDYKDKIIQKNYVIKKNISILRHFPDLKKKLVYRKFIFNKKINMHTIEKENDNEERINSIWFGQKTRELKNLKNISINDYIEQNDKDKTKNISLIDSTNLISNSIDENEKNKKFKLSNAIKEFYNAIKSRGYSSFVRNKKSNTILNRKNKRKYISDFSILESKSVVNKDKSEKHPEKKIQSILPIIKDKNKIIFS